jgi:hypothetical protein
MRRGQEQGCAKLGRRRGHQFALCVDVGALGEEHVDEIELAVFSRKVERGPATLRWPSKGVEALGRGSDKRQQQGMNLGSACCRSRHLYRCTNQWRVLTRPTAKAERESWDRDVCFCLTEGMRCKVHASCQAGDRRRCHPVCAAAG